MLFASASGGGLWDEGNDAVIHSILQRECLSAHELAKQKRCSTVSPVHACVAAASSPLPPRGCLASPPPSIPRASVFALAATPGTALRLHHQPGCPTLPLRVRERSCLVRRAVASLHFVFTQDLSFSVSAAIHRQTYTPLQAHLHPSPSLCRSVRRAALILPSSLLCLHTAHSSFAAKCAAQLRSGRVFLSPVFALSAFRLFLPPVPQPLLSRGPSLVFPIQWASSPVCSLRTTAHHHRATAVGVYLR